MRQCWSFVLLCPVVQTLFPLNQPDEQGKFFLKIRTIVSVPSIYLRKLSYSSGSVSISFQYKINIKERKSKLRFLIFFNEKEKLNLFQMRKSVEFLILILCSLQIYLHPFRYWWHFKNQGGKLLDYWRLEKSLES